MINCCAVWGALLLFLCFGGCHSNSGGGQTPFDEVRNSNGAQLDMGRDKPPVISDFAAVYDKAAQVIRITYHVSDAEEKSIGLTPYYSADGGQSYQPFESAASGDAGTIPVPGDARKMSVPFPAVKIVEGMQIALLADDKLSFPAKSFMDQADTNRLKQHITDLYGIRNHITDSVHKNVARKMIADSMAAYGYQVIKQHFVYTEYQGENIIARKPGFGKAKTKLIICAHYDTTTDSPGADDNGSGIAGLLEMARLLSSFPSECSIELVAFDLEEFGMVGSSKYVALQQQDKEKIIAVVNMDMIGYLRTEKNTQKVPEKLALAFPAVKDKVAANDYRGDFIVCIANERSKDLRDEYLEILKRYLPDRKVISILTPGNSEVMPDLRYSDHSSFWDKDYPGIFISDGSDSRNPNYHSPNDKLGTLDYTFMRDIVKSILGFTLAKSNTIHGSTLHTTLKTE